MKKNSTHTGTSAWQQTKAALIEEEEVKLFHNVTFRQHIAQTQSSHDIIHITVDTLCHPGILEQEKQWCGFIKICIVVLHSRVYFFFHF